MNKESLFVEYLDHMGSDLTVVNAARASFGKESDWLYTFAEGATESHPVLQTSDKNLIRFLATGFRTAEWDEFLCQITQLAITGNKDALTTLLHNYKHKAQHWAPFGHPHVQLRLKMPLFLARQFVKHQVGGVWSEESRRYIYGEPWVYIPDEWHTRPEDIKQGSGAIVKDPLAVHLTAVGSVESSIVSYKKLLALGTAPEEARMVLPLNMMTTVVWTGSLLFWSRVCNQRVDSHAQLAAQELGKKIAETVQPLFPCSWDALTT